MKQQEDQTSPGLPAQLPTLSWCLPSHSGSQQRSHRRNSSSSSKGSNRRGLLGVCRLCCRAPGWSSSTMTQVCVFVCVWLHVCMRVCVWWCCMWPWKLQSLAVLLPPSASHRVTHLLTHHTFSHSLCFSLCCCPLSNLPLASICTPHHHTHTNTRTAAERAAALRAKRNQASFLSGNEPGREEVHLLYQLAESQLKREIARQQQQEEGATGATPLRQSQTQAQHQQEEAAAGQEGGVR